MAGAEIAAARYDAHGRPMRDVSITVNRGTTAAGEPIGDVHLHIDEGKTVRSYVMSPVAWSQLVEAVPPTSRGPRPAPEDDEQ